MLFDINHKISILSEIASGRIQNIYHSIKRKNLKNEFPTIISINCIGGIMYHDLGSKFYSPTINLTMDSNDFITFIENLELFLKVGELNESISDNCNYPVGELKVGALHIEIRFIHYPSFEEAKSKWFQRANRVNFDNLFIIWEVAKESGPDLELWNRFNRLPYKNKILITGNNFTVKSKHIFHTSLYNRKYFSGKILTFRKGLLFYKRYLDSFNYIKFLNGNYFK